jgi:hypothetical protein
MSVAPAPIGSDGMPSPVALLYLAASWVVRPRKLHWLSTTVAVPCRDVHVVEYELEAELFAAAFLCLRDAGFLELTLTDSDFYQEAEVALLHAVTQPGVLNRLLEEIAPSRQRVARVAGRLYDRMNIRLWMAAEQELAALGYLTEPEPSLGSTVRRMLGHSPHLKPNCEAIGRLDAACQHAVWWWQRLQQTEATLFLAVATACTRAVIPSGGG